MSLSACNNRCSVFVIYALKKEEPEITKAAKALENYLKENNLDPAKDWSKDKTHGNYPRIDHIFSSGFTPLRFATVDQRYEKVLYISDHYPIAAVLEFK